MINKIVFLLNLNLKRQNKNLLQKQNLLKWKFLQLVLLKLRRLHKMRLVRRMNNNKLHNV